MRLFDSHNILNFIIFNSLKTSILIILFLDKYSSDNRGKEISFKLSIELFHYHLNSIFLIKENLFLIKNPKKIFYYLLNLNI